MSTRNMTLIALLTALLCISGPLTLPLGPIPLSLSTAVLALNALLLGPAQAAGCGGLYLMIGLLGVPVFSGFTGGIGALAGPTGGFLLGYLPVTALWGWGWRAEGRLRQGISLAAGMLLLYAAGTAWYALQTGMGLCAALAVCVLPFLAGDVLKMAAVLLGGNAVKSRLKKAGLLK